MSISRALGAALFTAMLATACSDGTGPAGEPFDPAQADADVAAFAGLLTNPQLAAFSSMSVYFDLSGAPLAAVSSARAMISPGHDPRAAATQVALAAAEGLALKSSGGSAPSLAVLPPSVFGTTFVFDDATDAYVPSDRTGAPANGVRFIIYAIDPITGDPIVGTEVGHADLIDTSAGSQTTAGLRLLLVGGSTTYLDYAFTASATQSSALLEVDGFLTDGATRLNFAIDAAVTIGQQDVTLDVDFSFAIPSRQFSITGSIDGMGSSTGALGQVTLTILSGGTNVRFVVDADATTLNATVFVNNAIFATISGDPANPTVLGAGGAPLTQEEIDALGNLFQAANSAFEFFGTLLAPIDILTGGAVVP